MAAGQIQDPFDTGRNRWNPHSLAQEGNIFGLTPYQLAALSSGQYDPNAPGALSQAGYGFFSGSGGASGAGGNPFGSNGQTPGTPVQPGYGSSGGTLNAVTQPGPGGTLLNPGTQAAAGSWWKNPDTWKTALGAVGGAYNAYNEASQGGGTTSKSSVTTPWGPISGDLDAILAAARQQFATPVNYQGGGGGGGGGPSSETQALLALLGGQARNGTPLMNAANQAAIGQLGDPYAGNQLTQQWNDILQSSIDPGRAYESLFGFAGSTPEGYTPGQGYDRGGASSGPTYGGHIGGAGGSSGGGGIAGGGLFDQYIRQYLDLGENPHTQEMIDNFQREAEEDYKRSISPAMYAMEGAGRLGSGFHQATLGLLGEEYNEATQGQIASLLAGDLSERRNLGLGALGLQGQREISDAQIRAQRDASNASSASAANAARMQYDLGMRGLDIEEMLGTRGQNLSALGSAAGYEQGVMGLGTGLAGQLGSQQLGLMSLIPGLSEAGFGAMDRAMSGNLQADQLRAQQAARAQQAGLQQQMEPGQRLDDYMRRILGLSDRFSPTQGEVNQPSPYGDPTTAALLGLFGGGLATYGATRGA